MSNFRKVVKRRDHWERSQPESRAKLGFLEKHRDYVRRAQNFHQKQDKLNALKQAARLRNPDEFYHRMERDGERVTGKGAHIIDQRKSTLTGPQLKQLKTQDRNYLLMQKQQEAKKIEKLRAHLHGIEAADLPRSISGGKRKREDEDDDDDIFPTDDDDGSDNERIESQSSSKRHVIFAADAQSLQSFDAASYFNTVPELVHRSHNRLTATQLASAPVISAPSLSRTQSQLQSKSLKQSQAALDAIDTQRSRSYQEILDRVNRSAVIDSALNRVESQRTLMTKGRRSKSVVRDKFGEVDDTKTVFKWKLQRKK